MKRTVSVTPSSWGTCHISADFSDREERSVKYFRRTLSIITACLIVGGLARQMCQHASATIIYQTGDNGALSSFDTATGVTTDIGVASGVGTFTSLSFDANGVLYGIGHKPGIPQSLYRIGPADGTAKLVGSTGLSHMEALTFGFDGALYTTATHAPRGMLYRINPVDASATPLAPLDLYFGLDALTVAPIPVSTAAGTFAAGTLFGHDPMQQQLYAIDPTTFEKTEVLRIPLYAADETIAFDSEGTLYGNNWERDAGGRSGWWKLDLSGRNEHVHLGTTYEHINGSAIRVNVDLDAPVLWTARLLPAEPLATDSLSMDIGGAFPSSGFDIELPPNVVVHGNDIAINIPVASPTGSPQQEVTPFSVTADIGMLDGGTYNYSIDLLVDDLVASSLNGAFDVTAVETKLVEVGVRPGDPRPEDFIIAGIHGTFISDGFHIQLPLNVSVDGNNIVVDILAVSPAGSPPSAFTPFNVETGHGRLPTGLYRQTVNLYVDGLLTDTLSGSFQVIIPEPTSMVLLALGSSLLLARRR